MGATSSTALNPCCPCMEEDKYHDDLMDGKDAALFPYDLGEILGKGLTSSVYQCKSECVREYLIFAWIVRSDVDGAAARLRSLPPPPPPHTHTPPIHHTTVNDRSSEWETVRGQVRRPGHEPAKAGARLHGDQHSQEAPPPVHHAPRHGGRGTVVRWCGCAIVRLCDCAIVELLRTERRAAACRMH